MLRESATLVGPIPITLAPSYTALVTVTSEPLRQRPFFFASRVRAAFPSYFHDDFAMRCVRHTRILCLYV